MFHTRQLSNYMDLEKKKKKKKKVVFTRSIKTLDMRLVIMLCVHKLSQVCIYANYYNRRDRLASKPGFGHNRCLRESKNASCQKPKTDVDNSKKKF